MLNIFDGDAFGLVPLTDAINKLKFVPGRIGAMGLFQETGVTTTTVAIEEKNGLLALIPPTGRGGPGTTFDKLKRTVRDFKIPHFEINDTFMAEEVQGVRAFGSETELETVQDKVMERMAELSQSMEATCEYARIGAIKGVVTYANGAVFDLFDGFDVTQLAEVDFDLDNANPDPGVLRQKCAAVIRSMSDELDGTTFQGVHAFCGDAFFDALLAHTEIRASYLQTQQAAELRSGYVANGMSYGSLSFGGIVWENYRGKVSGVPFVNTDKCHLFPVGVPSLFRTYFAPADYEATVNTMGRRLYATQFPMPNGKGRNFDVQMNALSLCTRPRALIQGKRT